MADNAKIETQLAEALALRARGVTEVLPMRGSLDETLAGGKKVQTDEEVATFARRGDDLVVPTGKRSGIVGVQITGDYEAQARRAGLTDLKTCVSRDNQSIIYWLRLQKGITLRTQPLTLDASILGEGSAARVPSGTEQCDWFAPETSPTQVDIAEAPRELLELVESLPAEPELPEFPVEVLGPKLAPFISSISESIQIAPDLPALSLLPALSACMSRRCKVRIGRSHVEHLTLWTLVAQDSGERKSAAKQKAMGPVKRREAELLNEHDLIRRRWANDTKILDKRIETHIRAAGLKDNKNSARDEEEVRNLEATRKEEPPSPGLSVNDTTPEALKIRMRRQEGRALIDSDEGGLLTKLADDKQSLPDIDVFLKGKSAGEIIEDRVGRGQLVIREAVLNIALALQPDLVRKMLANTRFQNTGMNARCLYSFPPSWVGHRFRRDVPVDPAAERQVDDIVRRLYDLTPGTVEYQIVGEALDVYSEFADRVEKQIGKGRKWHHVRSWMSKIAGDVANIATVFHAVDLTSTYPREVSKAAVERAVALADRYLIPHALHAFSYCPASSASGGQDVIDAFLSERTSKRPGVSAWAADLYSAFCEFCERHKAAAPTPTKFGILLRERGIEKGKVSGIRAYLGIELIQQ